MAKPAVSDVDGDQENFGDPKPFDPHFKGPIKNRSCTDILCLFLFVAFIAGWVVVAYFAFSMGDPKKLLYPTDSQGNICGTGEFKDKPYLFFFDIMQCARTSAVIKGCNTLQVCVAKCPDKNAVCKDKTCSGPEGTLGDSEKICKYKVDPKNANEDDCAKYYLKSTPLAGRCLPTGVSGLVGKDGEKLAADEVKEAGKNLADFINASDVGVRIFQDLSSAWWMMIVFLIFAMVVSFLWILVMRWIAGFMVFLSIVLVVVLIGFAAGFSFYTYFQIDKQLEVDAFKIEIVRNLNTFTSSKNTWLVSGIIFGVTWIILVLMLIFLRKRINLAIALIREGSKAVGSTISSLFFPIIPYILQFAVFVFWGAVAIYIASASKGKAQLVHSNDDDNKNVTFCDPENHLPNKDVQCLFMKYEGDDNLFRAQIYNLFGLFWCLFFAVGFGQVSLAGAFASYYWAFDKSRDVPYFAVGGGMYRAFRFHMGSIAFGSLIIAVVRMIRVLLDYIDTQCKKYKNMFTKIVLMCCKCCFWCLERFLRFISKNAYIMMSVYGENFCSSAKESFKLLMRNVVRVVVLDKVTDYLLLLGKLVVVGITAVAAFFFFSGKVKYLNDHTPMLNYYFLPVITVTIGSYLIATVFFNVYSMAIDTLFLCFLEDCERNDGSTERPYYMSRELMKILGKKNKFREQP